MMNPSLGNRIVAQDLMIQRLLSQAALVGGIYNMGFGECLVLTNDLWKSQAGGIPQQCFLLATAMAPGQAPDAEDEEVILLRIVGPGALPAEAELIEVRADAMRQMIEKRGASGAAAPPAVLDVLTRNEIQFSALKAKVLGTFYDTDVNGVPLLAFGSDLDTFYSSSRYKVYKPYGDSLALIASHPLVTEDEERARQDGELVAGRLEIGRVRYSSTDRRRRQGVGGAQDTAVAVMVRPQDFVALKTAVFGMSRLGKSNTMKTIATAICQYAAETGQRIGQLLFDPAGEYANVNVQDRTALSQIGPEFVTIFRYGAPANQPGIRPLSNNFFSDESIEVTWAIIASYLRARKEADYVNSFLSADVTGPENEDDDRRAFGRAQRRRAALYATLLKAGFDPPPDLRVRFPANKDVLSEVNRQAGNQSFQGDRMGRVSLTATTLVPFWDALAAAKNAGANLGDWVDPGLNAILTVYSGSVGSGYRILEPLRVYHSANVAEDYAAVVLSELIDGKIVIIDLSLGSETVLRFCSERIVNFILQDSARRFSQGEEMRQIQIYIEEAHRLFNRDRMNAPSDADPYVRLGKEAAKYRIGLIYATQEVSSVADEILANTSNWIVTHLNNHAEIKELAKYYDFQDFSELTLKAEDVGFARVKTRSGRYIVPTQVALFDEARVQAAQDASLRAAQARG